MTPVILTDLDDTIFTTLKSYPGVDPATMQRVTTAKNGNHSYMCAHRQAILAWLAAGATLVPVTARSRDAYRRVHLDCFADGAVLSNGALILMSDGSEDITWSQQVAAKCKLAEHTLQAAAEAFQASSADIRIHRHIHNGVLLGMTVKSNDETEAGVLRNLEAVQQMYRETFSGDEAAVHRNGNNLAFVPAGVSKRAAVQHLLSTRDDLQGRPVIGAGDSLADLPFMELCTMMLVPGNTQNSKKLFS